MLARPDTIRAAMLAVQRNSIEIEAFRSYGAYPGGWKRPLITHNIEIYKQLRTLLQSYDAPTLERTPVRRRNRLYNVRA